MTKAGTPPAPLGLHVAFHEQPFQPLVTILTNAHGVRPSLAVLEQRQVSPPHPAYLASRFPADASLLQRETSYVLEAAPLSFHSAYVHDRALPGPLAEALHAGQTNLGRIFAATPVEKRSFVSGDSSGEREPLVDALAARARGSKFAWRRYEVSMSGQLLFLVAEILVVPDASSRRVATGGGA